MKRMLSGLSMSTVLAKQLHFDLVLKVSYMWILRVFNFNLELIMKAVILIWI